MISAASSKCLQQVNVPLLVTDLVFSLPQQNPLQSSLASVLMSCPSFSPTYQLYLFSIACIVVVFRKSHICGKEARSDISGSRSPSALVQYLGLLPVNMSSSVTEALLPSDVLVVAGPGSPMPLHEAGTLQAKLHQSQSDGTHTVYTRRWWILFVYSMFAMTQGWQWGIPGPLSDTFSALYNIDGNTVQLVSYTVHVLSYHFFQCNLPKILVAVRMGLPF
jgi:hypothetical protein